MTGTEAGAFSDSDDRPVTPFSETGRLIGHVAIEEAPPIDETFRTFSGNGLGVRATAVGRDYSNFGFESHRSRGADSVDYLPDYLFVSCVSPSGADNSVPLVSVRSDLVRSASERADRVDSVSDVFDDKAGAEKAVNDGDSFTGELAYLSSLMEFLPYDLSVDTRPQAIKLVKR
jgi:hypothetical protein